MQSKILAKALDLGALGISLRLKMKAVSMLIKKKKRGCYLLGAIGCADIFKYDLPFG